MSRTRRPSSIWPEEATSTAGGSLGDVLTETLSGSVVRPLPDLRYQLDPIGWARDVLGIPEWMTRWSLLPEYDGHQWDGTPDPLVVIAERIASGRDVGVESGTGVGKTFLGGWLAPWFLVCFRDAIVVTTAPKEDQLTLHLWKELNANFAKLARAYPSLTRAHLRLRARPPEIDEDEHSQDKWAVIGYACGVDAETSAMGGQGAASRAKGFHAQYLLVITEETQGIQPAVMTSLSNTCTGDHNLRLGFGNPESQSDSLHTFCTSPGVVQVRISALDHPNVVTGRDVIPGAVGRKSITKRRAEYGEDSPLYDAQVRGISPAQAAEALIRREWLERSAARYGDPEYRKGKGARGVDVANSLNGDRAAIARGLGRCLLEVVAFQCPDSNQLGRDVYSEIQRDRVDPGHVGVDPVGVGAGCMNELNRLTGWRAEALNGGASPVTSQTKGKNGESYEWVPDANLFDNLRSQMHWQLREDLRTGEIALPNDAQLFREAVLPRFRVVNGKTRVEPKDDIRKRLGGKSPDKFDALVLWNWVRPRELTPPPAAPLPERPWQADRDSATFVVVDHDQGRDSYGDFCGGIGGRW